MKTEINNKALSLSLVAFFLFSFNGFCWQPVKSVSGLQWEWKEDRLHLKNTTDATIKITVSIPGGKPKNYSVKANKERNTKIKKNGALPTFTEFSSNGLFSLF